jgi:hypothetical protein
VVRLGSSFSVKVFTRDFEVRPLTFFDTPQGIQIDWESWVGWSEMPWSVFLSAKPTHGKLFRLKLLPVDYFNFLFANERLWNSFRLTSPEGDLVIFGYAERNSTVDYQLRSPPGTGELPVTLMLKFPENAKTDNQVIIEQVIASGWVLETGEKP